MYHNIINLLDDHYPEHEPVVRYAFPDDNGVPKQPPRLQSIREAIPDGANWVSAIYLATEDQLERLDENADNPYGNPSKHNIAKTIQDECEMADRVLYSVHAESDAHEDDDSDVTPLCTMVGWLQNWVQQVIGKDPSECTFYYSGNRSIHVHSQYFVTEANLRWLKERTKEFCDETGAELDPNVYKLKQQFRLPGAVHGTTRLQKVEIETDWDHDTIIRNAATDVERPSTYADVLQTHFSSEQTSDLLELMVSSAANETRSASQTQSASPLTTWPSRYKRPHDDNKDRAYTAPSFYPYPTGDDNDGHSVASVRIEGDMFHRMEAGKNRTFVPCYFYGAHACSGRDYTKDNHYAPLQLSKKDEQEWDYNKEDKLIILGGGNYRSIIHKVSEATAEHVGELLDPEDGDRDDAKDYLTEKGFDVGSTGRSQPPTTSVKQPTKVQSQSSGPKTDAAKLQQRAEQGSIEMSLAHGERRDVANRLLIIGGWDYAWQWFREQYGDDFDPLRTWKGFNRIIEAFPEDFADIEVPAQP